MYVLYFLDDVAKKTVQSEHEFKRGEDKHSTKLVVLYGDVMFKSKCRCVCISRYIMML